MFVSKNIKPVLFFYEIKKFVISIFYLFSSFYSYSRNNDSTKVNKKRVFLVSSSLSLYFGASFYYVQNSWWSDKANEFHFDPGNDLVYALNVDKAAHFLEVYMLQIFFRHLTDGLV